MNKNFASWLAPIFALIAFILAAVFLKDLSKWTMIQYYRHILHPPEFNVSTTGQIGDTIGGTTAPYIALLAGFLTFIAFWAQLRANAQVRDQFEIQQFESQYFELIRLHKENINEMKITGYHYLNSVTVTEGVDPIQKSLTRTETERVIEGRKVFVTMVTELNACFEFCKAYSAKFNIQESELNKLAYRIFFFGSFSELVSSANHQEFVGYCKSELKKIRKEHRTSSGGVKKFHVDGKMVRIHIKYAPFSGHESRLAHYYRHLFSTVKFVVKKEKEGLFNYNQAREYLKILRAQMSNDEQILLYHNYISGVGKDWEKADNLFLSRYRMLHNLPIDNVKYVETPRIHFKTVIDQITKLKEPDPMFEWGDTE
jgi:hypothetical protein